MNDKILKFSEFLDFYKDKYAKTSSEISIPNQMIADFMKIMKD